MAGGSQRLRRGPGRRRVGRLVLVGFILLAALVAVPASNGASRQVQSAKWTVIVEGTATATHGFTEIGRAGLCTVNVSGSITHNMTLQRGKGLTFVAVKKRGQYGLERVGNNTDITLVVNLTISSQGSVNVQAPDPLSAPYCPPHQADLSTGCPKKSTFRQDFGFKFNGSSFALVEAAVELQTPQPTWCAKDQYTDGLLDVVHGFPDEPEVGFVPFPFTKLFGRHPHAFLVRMTSGQITDPPKNGGTPPLLSTLNDSGSTSFTLRFIPQH
jgi:hypothetical protein